MDYYTLFIVMRNLSLLVHKEVQTVNIFEKPKFKVIMFASNDVITTSGQLFEIEKDGYTSNNDEYEDILDKLFI